MSNTQKITLGIATLALVVAGVAMFRGGTERVVERVREFSGTTNYDVIAVDEIDYNVASSTTLSGEWNNTIIGYVNATIPSGETYQCWKNDQVVTVDVIEAEMGIPPGGTASSTLRMNMFATSTIPNFQLMDFVNMTDEASSTILHGTNIATSTTATSTSRIIQLGDGNLTPLKTVSIPPNEFACAFIQTGDASAGMIEAVNSGIYGNATSSDRLTGVQPFWRLKFLGN